MTTTSEQTEYSLRVLISDWLLIDGTMDNHVQSAIDGSVQDDMDEEGEDRATRLQTMMDLTSTAGRSVSAGIAKEVENTELPRVAQLGTSIRQAGWDQIPGWPHDAEGFKTWPTPGQTATMTLTGAQWNLVIVALHYWADVDERLSDAKGAAKSRAIATAVGQRLTEQGWST